MTNGGNGCAQIMDARTMLPVCCSEGFTVSSEGTMDNNLIRKADMHFQRAPYAYAGQVVVSRRAVVAPHSFFAASPMPSG